MLNNIFTINELSKFLGNKLKGWKVSDVYSQEKNKLIIELASEVPDSGESPALEYSVDKGSIYLILRDNFSRAKRNFAGIFEEIIDCNISEIRQYNNDRAVSIKLSNDLEIIFTFFSNKANCFITRNNIVLNSFKDKLKYSGKSIDEIIPIAGHTETDGLINIPVSKYLKLNYRSYGDLYCREVLFRQNISSDEIVNDEIAAKLFRGFKELENTLENPVYVLYTFEENITFSLTELSHLQNYTERKFSDINKLITEYLKIRFRDDKITEYRSSKEKLLNRKISLINGKIESLKKQLEHSAGSDSLRKAGELILSNSYLIKKGDTNFSYTDETGTEVNLKLKENLSPSENAQHYFERYKKQKSSVNILKAKAESFEKEKINLMKELEESREVTDLKKIIKEEKRTESVSSDETSRFRKFTINEKYEVWVGKDSISNDLLTTKYASQNDLWFHVRGASGSHTVLKVPGKKEDIGKEIIFKAASIAAYYSKARNSNSVPVAYCEKKYVKKKKGFKAGSVVMEREKVIFVKPSLPENK